VKSRCKLSHKRRSPLMIAVRFLAPLTFNNLMPPAATLTPCYFFPSNGASTWKLSGVNRNTASMIFPSMPG
jgi:hypothetical protein